MSRIFVISFLCLAQLFALDAVGQTTLTFDAASIKKAEPQVFATGTERKMAKQTGRLLRPVGPGTNDPGRIHYPSISLKALVKAAFSAKDYELIGPDWMETETFAIDATMPPSTTAEQFRLMLQSLLAERFKLRIHRESRELQTYSLAVAKNGLKLKVAGSDHETATGADGAPLILADQLMQGSGPVPGSLRWTGVRATMNDLVMRLADETQSPVTDDTGLKDKYDFTLAFRPYATAPTPDVEALPDIFDSLRSIGLRLDASKRPVPVIVVDHNEKTANSN